MERKQFTFYRSFYESLFEMPLEERLGAIMALCLYALDGIRTEGLSHWQALYMRLAYPNLDASRKKAAAGSVGGQISKRGPAKKISKGEIEKENEIEIETETESEGEGFLRFWGRYPLKLGRQEAFAQWESVSVSEEEILCGLDRWVQSELWHRENGRFIPKPEKWLKEQWWLQDPKKVVPTGASGHLGKAELEAIEAIMRDEN